MGAFELRMRFFKFLRIKEFAVLYKYFEVLDVKEVRVVLYGLETGVFEDDVREVLDLEFQRGVLGFLNSG